MLRKIFSLGLVAMAACTTIGCDDHGRDPQPECYSGKIVGASCAYGVLIDVDAVHAIGSPAYRRGTNGNVLLGRNVIAVLNSQALGSLAQVGSEGDSNSLGRRLYFTTTDDSTPDGPHCLAVDNVQGNVPKLMLANVSTVSCREDRPRCGNN